MANNKPSKKEENLQKGIAAASLIPGEGTIVAALGQQKLNKMQSSREKKEAKAANRQSAESSQSISNASTGWIMVLLSLLVYTSDVFLTRFNGIDIKFFTDLSNLDWVMKSGVAMFLIIFLFQYMMGKLETKEDKGTALLFSIIVTFIIIVTGYSIGTVIHLLFVGVLWSTIIKPRYPNNIASAYKTIIILLVIDFIGFSLLEYIFQVTGLTGGLWFANRIILPIYTLYLLGYLGAYAKSALASFFLFFLISLYVIGSVATSPGFSTFNEYLSEEKNTEALSFFDTTRARTSAFGAAFLDPFSCYGFVGTSGKYESCLKEKTWRRECILEDKELKNNEVELNRCIQTKKIGTTGAVKDKEVEVYTKVEFNKEYKIAKQLQKEFAPPLQARLDIDSQNKPIDIEFSCSFKFEDKIIEGDIISENPILGFEGKKSVLVQCRPFSPYQEGKYKITFEADIQGINTRSTLTRIFAAEGIKDSRKSEIQRQFGLSSTERAKTDDEFAAFAFNMGATDEPFLIGQPVQPLSGNLINIGEGIIQSVEGISIELPSGVIPTANCYNAFDPYQGGLIAKKELLTSLRNLEKLKKGQRGTLLLGCNLNIQEDLLNPIEYAKRDIFSYLTYSYKIKKEGSFEVISSTIT